MASDTEILEEHDLIPCRSRMTKQFPFPRAWTLGSVAAAVTLCMGLQVKPSAKRAGQQEAASPPWSSATAAPGPRRLLDGYCVPCHNERLKTADLRLDR